MKNVTYRLNTFQLYRLRQGLKLLSRHGAPPNIEYRYY